ncbi:MAG: hypothetical protein IPQ07_17990 [Myxococcales bacterium]|nr:hypothetical protein [Myxococcales bacterium]
MTIATSASMAPVLRLLPGTYNDLLSIASPTTIKIVATGATLAGTGRLEVKSGNVDVRDLVVQSTVSQSLRSSAVPRPQPPLPTLAMHRSSINAIPPNNPLAVFNCRAHLDTTQISGDVTRLDDDGTLELDRVLYQSPPTSGQPASIFAFSKRLKLVITNSQLENVLPFINTTDLATTNVVDIAFNTIVLKAGRRNHVRYRRNLRARRSL